MNRFLFFATLFATFFATVSCSVPTSEGTRLVFTPDDVIDWEQIDDGDTICLTGKHVGTIEIKNKKDITIDGNCSSPGSINGLVTPSWKAQGSVWKTAETFPALHGRYSSWVLLDGKLKTLDDARLYRKDDYIYSKTKPDNIQIPKYYAGIFAVGTSGLTIKNISLSHYSTHGIRVSNSINTVIKNVTVSWVGGGINPGFPRAGAGITFDGETENALVTDSHVSQCFDTGFSMQLFKKTKQHARHLRFIDVHADRCGAGLSIATHRANSAEIDDVEIVGRFTNLGYGWSGTDNNVHGRGVLIKQFDTTKITNVKLHDSVIDTFAWVGVLHRSGELDAWNNVITNGTGEYQLNKNVRPAAYTAHGMDYSAKPSDDEAIGSFRNNTIVNNNAFAFQVIHNTPKASTRQLTIENNTVSGNAGEFEVRTSSGLIR